ncbi:hypothetical protein ABT121_34595 [Streptomyces sp. NPDC001928]|uniref:hypothetical protein n=1 Tax=Streptomyces sp. NPDC001928 TaxID=3154404 RepID=UPI00332755AD
MDAPMHAWETEQSAAVGDQAREHTEAAHTPLWVLAAAGLLSCTALAAVCWMSGHVHPDPTLQTVARFLHVAALVVGLGAVLAVDWSPSCGCRDSAAWPTS